MNDISGARGPATLAGTAGSPCHNRCIAETDPLGRTTRAGYDAAGRQSWQEDPDGRRTTWSFDGAGRLIEVAVDGRALSAFEHHPRERRVTVTDHTGPTSSTIELQRNRRGQLVQRSASRRSVQWTYDRDGRRTSMMLPDGNTVTYAYDRAGRLAAIDHPLLGQVAFSDDVNGQLIEAIAGGVRQRWTYADGRVVEHSVASESGTTTTTVSRDAEGRIVAITGPETETRFDYDDACQLVEARTGTEVSTWRYDAAGRMVGESVGDRTLEQEYDASGQLINTRTGGLSTAYFYDGAGRRVREESSEGRTRLLEWAPSGWLAGITDARGKQGGRRTDLHVDATGTLASINGTGLLWDTAAHVPTPVMTGSESVLSAGTFTGVDGAWLPTGWRTQRATEADPWKVGSSMGIAGLAGVGLGADGGLTIAGMQWLGARIYDPGTRGFLSVDPLEPTIGSGWAGNPYSYAGNDPLHALDPLGLKPLTDQELTAYNAAHNAGFAAAKDWVEDSWEYLAGGVMVIAGGVMVATGVGGPAGMMLISAGGAAIIQKSSTGRVHWGQVALAGGLGLAGAGAGAYATKAALEGGQLLAYSIGTNAVIGGVSDGGNYLFVNGSKSSARGLLGAVTGGVISGGAMGGSGSLGTLAARNLGGVRGVLVQQGTQVTVDAGGGMIGSTADQLISSGRAKGGDVLNSGAACGVTGLGALQAERVIGRPELAYQGLHRVGPQHRSPTLFDHRHNSAGVDVPIGHYRRRHEQAESGAMTDPAARVGAIPAGTTRYPLLTWRYPAPNPALLGFEFVVLVLGSTATAFFLYDGTSILTVVVLVATGMLVPPLVSGFRLLPRLFVIVAAIIAALSWASQDRPFHRGYLLVMLGSFAMGIMLLSALRHRRWRRLRNTQAQGAPPSGRDPSNGKDVGCFAVWNDDHYDYEAADPDPNVIIDVIRKLNGADRSAISIFNGLGRMDIAGDARGHMVVLQSDNRGKWNAVITPALPMTKVPITIAKVDTQYPEQRTTTVEHAVRAATTWITEGVRDPSLEWWSDTALDTVFRPSTLTLND